VVLGEEACDITRLGLELNLRVTRKIIRPRIKRAAIIRPIIKGKEKANDPLDEELIFAPAAEEDVDAGVVCCAVWLSCAEVVPEAIPVSSAAEGVLTGAAAGVTASGTVGAGEVTAGSGAGGSIVEGAAVTGAVAAGATDAAATGVTAAGVVVDVAVEAGAVVDVADVVVAVAGAVVEEAAGVEAGAVVEAAGVATGVDVEAGGAVVAAGVVEAGVVVEAAGVVGAAAVVRITGAGVTAVLNGVRPELGRFLSGCPPVTSIKSRVVLDPKRCLEELIRLAAPAVVIRTIFFGREGREEAYRSV